MSETRGPTPGALRLQLGDSLTVAAAAQWHARFVDAVDTAPALEMDGGALETIDGAGLQLLAALGAAARARRLAFSWVGVSEPLRRAASATGLGTALMLDPPA